jgi:hypothetical protein
MADGATIDTRPLLPTDELATESGRLYWAAIEPVWERVSIYDGAETFTRQFASVTEAQGLLLAAHWCQSEVCNGGLHQFFSNPTGVLAPEAVRGFGLLELGSAAEIVASAMRMLGQLYPRDHATRHVRLGGIERPGSRRAEWDPFHGLDREFYEVAGTLEFAARADAFVRSHLALFFRER